MLQRLCSKLVKHKGVTLYEKLESLEGVIEGMQRELKAAITLVDKMKEDAVHQNIEESIGS